MPTQIDEIIRYADGATFRRLHQFTSRAAADAWLDARAAALIAAGLAPMQARVPDALRYGDGLTHVAHLIRPAA